MTSSIEEQTENNNNVVDADTLVNNIKRCMEMLNSFPGTEINCNNEDADTINIIKHCMELLNTFPVTSNFYNVGMRLREAHQPELARDAFQRGSETGCVQCMLRYSHCLNEGGRKV
jgi:hypothetical protein